MARPKKDGLLYFSFDVDFFSDKKIKSLKARYGNDGLIFYIYLLTEIYRNGYYIRWDEDYEDNTIVDLALTEGFIKQVMTFLVNRSLLSSITVNSDTIITSPGIQKRYQEAAKSLKREIIVMRDYWILDEEETATFIKFTTNHSKSEINHSKSEINHSKSEINSTNESKVNESKVNEKNNVQLALALFESLWKMYPCKKGKGQVSESKKLSLLKYGIEEMRRAIERYISELEKDKDWRKPQNGSTFFNSGYVDYLDCNYLREEKDIKEMPEEIEDRFSVLENEFRKELEDAGVIDCQSIVYGKATDEQIKELKKAGVL